MKTILRGLTVPVGIDGIYNAEDFIAYCAKVSNPANQLNTETADRLIRYLIRNAHWSPFEMVSMTVEIQTTRDIARQILRHRSFSFQEFSQRYAVATQFETREARLQDTKNRQNSIRTEEEDILAGWQHLQELVQSTAERAYTQALAMGVAKEQARAVLPEGLTSTTLYMAGTLRSWIHYVDLRSENGTQLEHMEIAKSIQAGILQEHFPNVCKAMHDVRNS
jgi:thymidylate synthase (FAD)